MCVAVVLFCVAFCSVFAFGVRVLWSICGVFVVGVFSATTFGRCLGSDAFHMTRLTVFRERASESVLHWVCCWHLRVHWLCVASISARDACATHVRHMCDTCATQVRRMHDTCATHARHRCDPCATHVRPPCDTRATHVRPMCDHHATYVRPMCDPCATTMRPPCDTRATQVRHRCGACTTLCVSHDQPPFFWVLFLSCDFLGFTKFVDRHNSHVHVSARNVLC